MLIKAQSEYDTACYQTEYTQEIRVVKKEIMLAGYYVTPTYYITIDYNGYTMPIARYLEKLDADSEYARCIEAWHKDEVFEFATDDKLLKKEEDLKEELKKEHEKSARQELQEMEDRIQKRCREIEDMERAERKIKKIFCCILIFIIYGIVIHIGTGLIKNPVMLAAVSIVVGVIGAAIAGAAKE